MAVNTSASGGYLVPSSPALAEDQAFEATVLQPMVAGITALDSTLVRPRWQMEMPGKGPPRVPNVDVDWCAVEVTATEEEGEPAHLHDGQGDGSTTLRRYLVLDVLASFYGPQSDAYAALLRDGLHLGQNREAMGGQGLNLIDCDPIRRVPEIINSMTRRRSDLPFRLRRRIERTYQILNVREADGTIHTTGGSSDGPTSRTEPFHVEP